MRLAVLISVAAFGLGMIAAQADGGLIRVSLVVGAREGYIVPREYAEAHQAEFTANIPGPVKIDGFWTPPEQDAEVADRVLRDLIDDAAKDPSKLFPDLAKTTDSDSESSDSLDHEQKELLLIAKNYDRYIRQFVGVIIEGQKLVFCNYSDGTKVDPSDVYIFTDKVFVPGGKVHFLQCRFEPKGKTCSNVSMIGSWQKEDK